MECSWNLHQRHFLKKMLLSDVISFDPCVFHNSGIISVDISRNLKVDKSLFFFFFKSTYLWKKIFISRYHMIIFIYKSWSVNSGWLTLFVRSKIPRGDSFNFKIMLTISSVQEQSFLTSTLLILNKIVKSPTLFLRAKVCYRHNWLY